MKGPPKDFGKDTVIDMTPFGDRLSALCAMELSAGKGDSDRIGGMIERLINAVSFTVAIAAKGDAETIDNLLRGAEAYLYEAAASHRPIASFMADPKNARRAPR